MKVQVRQGVFETNSSSTHSVSVCLATDWDAFNRGDLWMRPSDGKMLPADEAEEFNEELINSRVENSKRWKTPYTREEIIKDYATDLYKSHADYYAWAENTYYDFFDEGSVLSNGTHVVTFGYYGHDY
jgi:hypothetical protein